MLGKTMNCSTMQCRDVGCVSAWEIFVACLQAVHCSFRFQFTLGRLHRSSVHPAGPLSLAMMPPQSPHPLATCHPATPAPGSAAWLGNKVKLLYFSGMRKPDNICDE